MKKLLTLAPIAALLTACEDAGNSGNDNLLTGGLARPRRHHRRRDRPGPTPQVVLSPFGMVRNTMPDDRSLHRPEHAGARADSDDVERLTRTTFALRSTPMDRGRGVRPYRVLGRADAVVADKLERGGAFPLRHRTGGRRLDQRRQSRPLIHAIPPRRSRSLALRSPRRPIRGWRRCRSIACGRRPGHALRLARVAPGEHLYDVETRSRAKRSPGSSLGRALSRPLRALHLHPPASTSAILRSHDEHGGEDVERR